MKRRIIVLIIIIGILGCYWYRKLAAAGDSTMKLISAEFNDAGILPKDATCDGRGVNPSLRWSGLPADTKSIAIVMEDPDAQRVMGKPFIHWIVYNLPPTCAEIKQEQDVRALGGQEWYTTGGSKKYYPACPPKGNGIHQYHFRVYALIVSALELPTSATPEQAIEAIKAKARAYGEIIGLYERI